MNQLMLTRVTEGVIVVAESGKLGINNTFISGNISDITMLITDCDADRRFIEKLEDMGVRVILTEY
ncbi:MAG: hypothetical protein WBJ82_08595 [Tepidanaerobacteraceae bacterium]|nr:hypothetical protein [Tepidanaerobacter sp.]HQE05115.1 hypothetical protein [Tepidanaerobacteraceae bacterium]